MSTDATFIEFLVDQVRLGERLTWRKMFGEYALYLSGRVVGFAVDNSLFIKPSDQTAGLLEGLPRRELFPGSKLYPMADELLDDPERLRAVLLATEAAMPMPKPARPRRRKAAPSAGAGRHGSSGS